MKFSTAWASVAAQNVTLKVATVVLATTTVIQLFIITNLASRDLPVVERGCFSRASGAKPSEATKDEITSFLYESLPMRFDTTIYLKEGFLSLQETASRDKEQAALKQRQINQRVIVSNVKFIDQDIIVTADRLLVVAGARSALGLNLKVKVQQTNRTEANPYGLVLSSVNQIEDKDEK